MPLSSCNLARICSSSASSSPGASAAASCCCTCRVGALDELANVSAFSSCMTFSTSSSAASSSSSSSSASMESSTISSIKPALHISFCIACIVSEMSPILMRRFIAPMTCVLFTMCTMTFCCAAGGTPTAPEWHGLWSRRAARTGRRGAAHGGARTHLVLHLHDDRVHLRLRRVHPRHGLARAHDLLRKQLGGGHVSPLSGLLDRLLHL